MPPWIWVLVGSGGVITITATLNRLITTTATLIRHRMDIKFFRYALDRHGIEALNAAGRAMHPFDEAIRARREEEIATPDRDPAIRPTPPLPRESEHMR